MDKKFPMSVALAAAFLCLGGSVLAEEHEHGGERPAEPRSIGRGGEPHPGPAGYERAQEPHGWNARPGTVDREAYRHNYQAARTYRIGPYHRPSGWRDHHWVFGEILPRGYWGAQYILADYWLFGLEVPPAGYEWVREGADALMISLETGEILQVEYGVFA